MASFDRFHDEIMLIILGYLGTSDLIAVDSLSKWFRYFLSSCGSYLWIKQVDHLWKDKVHIPDYLKLMKSVAPKLCYFASLLESKRNFVTFK